MLGVLVCMLHEWTRCLDLFAWSFLLLWARGVVMKVAAPRKANDTPHSALPRLEPCVLDHPRGEGVRRDFSRLHPGRTGGSFEYAHVFSHMPVRWMGQG
jgi:hypothetical protein